MELIEKLKYGIIKNFGTGRFMKLKNDIAKNQRDYYQLNKLEIDKLNIFIEEMKDNPVDEEDKEKALAQNKEMQTYMLKLREIQIKQMEFMLVPAIVDELCAMVEKIGQQVTVNDIDIESLSLDSIVSLGYQIIRLDDPKSDEEAEEKKKITK